MNGIIVDPGSLIFVAALVSAAVTFLKLKVTSDFWRMAIVLVFSLIAGGIYVAVKDTNYWPTVLNILVWAGAIYSYIIRQLEKSTTVRRALGLPPKQ